MELLFLFKNTFFEQEHVILHLSLLFHFFFILMISYFKLVISVSACESFLFSIVTLWAVPYDKYSYAIATVIGSSSIFSNKTSSSWISFIVPSFYFSFWILFRLTSFLYKFKVKALNISSYCITKFLSNEIFPVTCELWTSSKHIGSGASSRIKVGDRWDGRFESSLSELSCTWTLMKMMMILLHPRS